MPKIEETVLASAKSYPKFVDAISYPMDMRMFELVARLSQLFNCYLTFSSMLFWQIFQPVLGGDSPALFAIEDNSYSRHWFRFSRSAGACPPRCPSSRIGVLGPLGPKNDASKKMACVTVGRGSVPRHCSRTPTLAGDRPPRYGKKRHFTVVR